MITNIKEELLVLLEDERDDIVKSIFKQGLALSNMK